jgi:hypothetical protein
LGPGVHLPSIFLIYKGDSYKFGDGEKFGVSMVDNDVTCSPEYDPVEVNAFGLSGDLGFYIAGPHGEKEGSVMMSAATEQCDESRWLDALTSFLRSRGVMAFWRRVGGSTLSKAFSKALMDGCMFWLPSG